MVSNGPDRAMPQTSAIKTLFRNVTSHWRWDRPGGDSVQRIVPSEPMRSASEREVNVDADRFDAYSRSIGSQADRRGVLRAALSGALGLVGLSVPAEDTLAKGYEGDKCKKNKNCGTGLHCKGAKKKKHKKDKKGKCRYKGGCGEKDDYCKQNDDCCGSRNRCRSNN